MTLKHFKEALLRGQGRCVQAAQAEPEKYRSVVVWACSHKIAFDTQCEGSRAWFVYELIKCYEDNTPFLKAAAEGLKKAKSNGGWKMLYLAELLGCFAADGEKSAQQLLWEKYGELYSCLLHRKCPKNGLFSLRDDFEMLCEVLAQNETAMVKIAEDIGRLYSQRTFYNDFDFDWLYATKAKRYMKALERRSKASEDIAQYLRAGQACENACTESVQNSKTNERLKGIALSVWLKKKADRETVLQYAKAYLQESDPDNRADALMAFSRCSFPGDPLPIIEDAKSNFGQLSAAAWQALANIRHPLVRGFAVENLKTDMENALPVFIMNYQKQDEQRLVALVKSIAVDFKCTTAWHGIHMDILGMQDIGLQPPAALLRYMYETTYCSCCREYIVRQMGKRRMLTNDILQECLHDCNADIRNYARRCLYRRSKPTVKQ